MCVIGSGAVFAGVGFWSFMRRAMRCNFTANLRRDHLTESPDGITDDTGRQTYQRLAVESARCTSVCGHQRQEERGWRKDGGSDVPRLSDLV
jgi:hypothetical protein